MKEYLNVSINGSGMVSPGEYNKIVVCGTGYGSNLIKANRFEVNGTFNLNGQLDCPNVVIHGALQAVNITSKKVQVTGKIDCSEIIAESMTIHSSNDCSIDSIKCDELVIQPNKGILLRFFNKTSVTVNTVECKQAEVSNLHSNRVKCETMNASGKTHIDKLICKECNKDESVFINDIVFI